MILKALAAACLCILSATSGLAATITVNGDDFELEIIQGSFNDNRDLLEAQPFFGNEMLAREFAQAALDLGSVFPQSIGEINFTFGVFVPLPPIMSVGSQAIFIGENSPDLGFVNFSNSAPFNFATVTPLAPVPLPAGGLLLLTGLGVIGGLRRRAASRSSKIPKVASGLFALSLMFSAGSAWAVTFNFVAERVAVGSNIAANTTVENASRFQTLTGTFSFDLTTPDSFLNPELGIFANTGTILFDQFQFDPTFMSTLTTFEPSLHQIQISNRTADLSIIDILIGDFSAMNGLLDSDALPDSLIPVSLLSNGASGLFFGREGEFENFASFDFTSITPVSAVPLPAGVVLLLTGLGVMGGLRRRAAAQSKKIPTVAAA